MYQIGDKIFYPMHGASVIEAIEEREILGKKTRYYVMNIKNMKVMFPIESNKGIRQIVNLDILEDVLKRFNHEESNPIVNPTHRHRTNMIKMKSGDIYEGAHVIRDLVRMGKKRALATGDKNMLDNAKQILTSELMLVKGITQLQADDLLEDAISNSKSPSCV